MMRARTRPQPAIALILVLMLGATRTPGAAQAGTPTVVDQTGLPLPGATVQLLDGDRTVATVMTRGDGTFGIDPALRGDTLLVSLDGFEPARIRRADAGHITLALARTSEVTTVIAPEFASAPPTTARLGQALSSNTAARLPSSRLRVKESLPLLPSVIRGPDGLMRVGGARAYDAPVFLDGFNVTDPASGLSNLNLPFETVRGVDVLNDPMAVTYGGLLAGVVEMDSKPGGDRFKMGVQGVIPRPRFSSPGFGRIEGIFPRVHANGSAAAGRLRYSAAAEYDYERIAVPDVTQSGGPDIVEESTTVFGRLDAQLNAHHAVSIDALAFPSHTRSSGLSPRREDDATPDLFGQDLFAGVTYRYAPGAATSLTVQTGALAHDSALTPKSRGPARLSPAGWQDNWFAAVTRRAVRYTTAVTWERVQNLGRATHHFSVKADFAARKLRGTVDESRVTVWDATGGRVRDVEFGPRATLAARDRSAAIAFRDLWIPHERIQIDTGGRIDYAAHGGFVPSARVGARLALNQAGTSVLKSGYGRFVGTLPLLVPAFTGYPVRVDRRIDPETGQILQENRLIPSLGEVQLPVAVAATLGFEQRLAEGLDGQVTFTDRRASRLATLNVPADGGQLLLGSSGASLYREVQVSVRRTWDQDQQLFVSYVRSTAQGELNDFSTLFQYLDVPLLQPGGIARRLSDAPHRVLVWGTFNLPGRVVISPVTEWHSGFPYSVLNDRYLYAAAPRTSRFPAFLSADLVLYKTVTVRRRTADVGIQVFNATNHWNPRDVYPVVGAPQFGEFANGVGPVLRGYILMKW